MVAWEQLSDEEREKDRDAIRDLPAILNAAGFTLILGDNVTGERQLDARRACDRYLTRRHVDVSRSGDAARITMCPRPPIRHAPAHPQCS